MCPDVSEDRAFFGGNVVTDRHAWELDDPTLNSVHEREVAGHPWEEGAFYVAGSAEEERCS